MVLVSKVEAKDWCKIEFTDDDSLIESLIAAATSYVSAAVSLPLSESNELHKLPIKILVNHWYDNRELIGSVPDQLQKSIDSIITAIEFGG